MSLLHELDVVGGARCEMQVVAVTRLDSELVNEADAAKEEQKGEKSLLDGRG